MKNLKLFVTTMFVMFVAVVGVSAAEMPAYATNDGTCTVDNITDLEAAISAKWEKTKKNGNVVEVSCTDIVIKKGSNITFDRDLTFNGDGNLEANEGNVVLDLNGHTITFSEYNYFDIFDAANVTLKNGNIIQTSEGSSAFEITQGATLKTSALTINVNGKYDIEEDTYPYAFGVSGSDNSEQATLVVSADTVVNVPHGNGLVLSSFANVTLDGTWNTYGSFVAYDNGATKTTNVKFVGGLYTTEYGITIPIRRGNWVFNGGTFISKNSVAVYIEKVNKSGAQTVKINNGVFETKNNGSKPLMADTLKEFVYGGIFKAPIISDEFDTKYLCTKKDCTDVNSVASGAKAIVENRVTYVGIESTIGIKESTNGKVESSKSSAVTGQEVTLTVTPDEGYELGTLTVTYGEGNKLEVTANEDGTYTFAMPANYVMVSAEFVKTYKVEVAADIANGTVTVDKTVAKEGDIVTITVTPDEGYKLVKVLVDGKEIKANEDGTYSFVMPAADVTVSAEFEKVPVNNPEAGGEENPGTENTPEEQTPADQNPTGNTPADENNSENPSTLDSIVSIVTLAISSLGTAGYSIKKFIRK